MQDMEPDEFALEPKQRMRYWKRQVAQFGQRVPLEDVVREMGLGHIPFQAFAQLYRNNISVGQPYYSNLEDGFAIEFGMKNDHKGCLRLLDALLQDIPHSRSCGLARVVVFKQLEHYVAFSAVLAKVMWIGYQASYLLDLQRQHQRARDTWMAAELQLPDDLNDDEAP